MLTSSAMACRSRASKRKCWRTRKSLEALEDYNDRFILAQRAS